MNNFRKLLALLFCLMLMGNIIALADNETADYVLLGTVYTADGAGTMAEAVAVKDGVIVYVGDADGATAWQGENTIVFQTENGMITPGFVDAHSHGIQGGVASLYQADVYGLTSADEYVDAVAEYIENHPDVDFIYATGYENGFMPADSEGGFTTLLDRASTEKPIVVVSQDHHSYWVNSVALAMTGVTKDTPDVESGVITRDAEGNPTGIFRENANSFVEAIVPDYTVEQYKAGVLAYQSEVVGYGLTAYWEPMANASPNLVQAYAELDAEGKLLVRTYGGFAVNEVDRDEDGTFTTILDAYEAMRAENEGGDFEFKGIKLFGDGVIEGHTAYMIDDYADTPGDHGTSKWTLEGMAQFITEADARGVVAHTHAIGDGAVNLTLDAIEAARTANPDSTVRHAITHLQIMTAEDIQRMADLNVIAVTNPYWFLKEPGYYEELEAPYLGEERASHEYPMKDLFDAGVVVTAASDYPVTLPPMPLAAIMVGVIRSYPYAPETQLGADQCVTVEQMLQASTLNGVYEYSEEDIGGSLEVGKRADLVMLGGNILTCDPNTIADTPVLMTMRNGQIMYMAE